jgi:NodT family efflux transporter outer membrane factor (OMF) lipoprotein
MGRLTGVAAALAVASAVAGCASFDGSAPRASLRDANGLQAQKSLQGVARTDGAWPAADWWTGFGDPQLAALIDEALKDSPTLRVAEARARNAHALAQAAGAALAPQVDVNASLQRERFSANGLYPPPYAGTVNSLNQATIDLSFDFDFWGRNRATLNAALGEARAAEVDTFAARLALSVSIAQAYIELQRNFDQLDIARATLEQRVRLRDLTSQRLDAGLDSRVELKQAETGLPEAREQIKKLEESIALSRNRIAALMGQGPDRGLALERPRARTVPARALPAVLPAELLGRRADIVAERWRVEAAARGIDAARAAFYPNVSLTAFLGLQAIGLRQFANAGSETEGIGPAVSLPIFNGGRLRANLSATHADYDAAVEQYNQALADALREVVDQLDSMRYIDAQRAEQRQAVATAQEAYDLAVLRYREGLGNYLQVLSVESQVLAQKGLAADLDARTLTVTIDLIRALGGGYEGAKS